MPQRFGPNIYRNSKYVFQRKVDIIHTPPGRSVAPIEVLYQKIKKVREDHIQSVVDSVKAKVFGSNLNIPDLCASTYDVTYDEPRGKKFCFLL